MEEYHTGLLACPEQVFPSAILGQLARRFAIQQVLLAVIFSFNIAPESRIGRESWESQNISARFSRISAKKPSGKGKWSQNWGDPRVFPDDIFSSLS
jgi:hypothetical protein